MLMSIKSFTDELEQETQFKRTLFKELDLFGRGAAQFREILARINAQNAEARQEVPASEEESWEANQFLIENFARSFSDLTAVEARIMNSNLWRKIVTKFVEEDQIEYFSEELDDLDPTIALLGMDERYNIDFAGKSSDFVVCFFEDPKEGVFAKVVSAADYELGVFQNAEKIFNPKELYQKISETILR